MTKLYFHWLTTSLSNWDSVSTKCCFTWAIKSFLPINTISQMWHLNIRSPSPFIQICVRNFMPLSKSFLHTLQWKSWGGFWKNKITVDIRILLHKSERVKWRNSFPPLQCNFMDTKPINLVKLFKFTKKSIAIAQRKRILSKKSILVPPITIDRPYFNSKKNILMLRILVVKLCVLNLFSKNWI